MFDLHVHSKFSHDSFAEPKHILKVAIRRGLQGIAITDHNVFRPFSSALSKEVIVVRGCEVTTEVGDITGLFLTESIKSKVSLDVVDEIRDQGGLVVLPHPFRDHKPPAEIVKYVDVVEGFNARVPFEKNERAIKLGLKWGKPVIAGSDAHFAFEVGRGLTLANDACSADELEKAILSNNISIRGARFANWHLSALYVMSKAVEARRNPKIIPNSAWKLISGKSALHSYFTSKHTSFI